MVSKSNEQTFQADIINQMIVNGWQLGTPDGYNRELALYEEDVLGFVQDTQYEQWQKYCKLYPQNPEKHLLEKVAGQLNKADPNAADRDLRTFGTLGVLLHKLRDRGARLKLCQFKPEHNPGDIMPIFQVIPNPVITAITSNITTSLRETE